MISFIGRPIWALLILVSSSFDLHANINESIEQAQLSAVGTGELTWWGIKVYDATLYAQDGSYHPDRPHAIRITYQLKFSREQLARKSLEEIERIFGTQPDRDALFQQLQTVFRDVTPGDHILGIHYPGQGAEFYSEDVLLGRIEDERLAAAFFSIWLDPETREPDLRAQMLGYIQ